MRPSVTCFPYPKEAFRSRYWRKGYRGNNSSDVLIQDLKTKKISQLTDTNLQNFRNHTQDVYPMWGARVIPPAPLAGLPGRDRPRPEASSRGSLRH